MLTQLESLQNPLAPIFTWAERDGQARLIVDDGLTVHWINSAGSRFVSETSLFAISHDRLELKEERWQRPFRSLIRGAAVKSSMICIPRPSNDHVLCTALNLGTGGQGGMIGLTLRSATRPLSVDGTALEAAFRLTSAERRVVETLFSGQTAEQAGAGLHVSVGTVRAHIRHIYEKVEVGSREAMFAKLSPYLA